MQLPDIPSGTRVTAQLLNDIRRQANIGANIRAGRGLNWKNLPGGPMISLDAQEMLSREPAQRVLVVNTGTDPIAAYSPAGIIESLGKTDSEMQSQRVLSVRLPKARDAGDFVIACDYIDAGAAGWAWCSGTCLVKLYRYFDSELLDRADVLAGQPYALASIDGGLDVLWSQRAASGDVIVDLQHYAVVRFNRRRPMRWFNSGTVDVPFGSPVTLVKTATDGLFAGVLSARAPNAADTLTSCFINLGGTVKSGEYGKCTADVAMARAKASYNALSTVGAEASQTAVSSAGSGLTVIARLGAYQGQQYDIVKQAGGTAYGTLSIIGGNTLDDGFTLGIKFVSGGVATVPSNYDPTVTSAFIDGIGRATLFLGGSSSGTVLVVNDGRASSGINAALFAADRVLASSLVSIPVAGDPNGATVSAYVPDIL